MLDPKYLEQYQEELSAFIDFAKEVSYNGRCVCCQRKASGMYESRAYGKLCPSCFVKAMSVPYESGLQLSFRRLFFVAEQNIREEEMANDLIAPTTTRDLERAILLKCMDCSGGTQKEILKCNLQPKYRKRTLIGGCPLWPYRALLIQQ